jgi:hypothetical protein
METAARFATSTIVAMKKKPSSPVLFWPNLAGTNHFSLRIALVELEAASLNDDVEVDPTAARLQDGFRKQVSGRQSPGSRC